MGAELALQAGIALLDFQAARYLMEGEVPPQVGNDHPTSMPTSAYTTADGHINVAASGEGMWARLCKAIERKDLLEAPEFKGGRSGEEPHAAERRDRGWLLKKTARNGSRSSTPAGCPAGRSTRWTRCSPIRRCSTSAAAEVEHGSSGSFKW